MTSPARLLLRALQPLRDHSTQVARWHEILSRSTPPDLLALLEDLLSLCINANPLAKEAWLSLIACIIPLRHSQPGLELLRSLREQQLINPPPLPIASALHYTLLLTRSPHRHLELPLRSLFPRWDRDITLGEKLALASQPSRAWLEQLLLEPEPSIILRLCNNPRLTLQDLLRVAARRPTIPDVQWAIAQSPRWLAQLPIRSALLSNPYTETTLSLLLLPTLPHPDLLDLTRSSHLHPDLHLCAQLVLACRA